MSSPRSGVESGTAFAFACANRTLAVTGANRAAILGGISCVFLPPCIPPFAGMTAVPRLAGNCLPGLSLLLPARIEPRKLGCNGAGSQQVPVFAGLPDNARSVPAPPPPIIEALQPA